jgi:hypothetical protein
MICAVDVEDTNFPSSWNTVKTFIEEFKRRTNNHPILLYSGFWWWQSRGWNASSLTPYVWDSRYVNGSGYASNLYAGVDDSWWNTRYGGWDRTTLLQFSSKGSAGGITGNVDVNAFNGTLAQLRSLTSSTSIKPYSSVVNDREIEMFLAKGTEANVVLTDASTFCGTPDLKTVDALVAAGIPYAEGVSDAWIAELLKELPLRAKSGGFTDAQVAVLAPQLASALREALVGAGVAVDSAVIRTALSETLSSVRINVQ